MFKAALRKIKHTAKDLLRPLLNPRIDRPAIAAALRDLGVRPGGILLVHSSLSALGYVDGGAAAVISALIEAVEPNGTLLMPTHTWEWTEAGCRTFDVRGSRVCVGAIPETFRKMPGVVRSLHPTHSVAGIGPTAHELLQDHELAQTPCGAGTPYAKLLDRDGQILFIGVDLNANTAFHTIEALVGAPYLLCDKPDTFTLIDDAGQSRSVSLCRHMPRIARRFSALEGLLIDRRVARKGWIGHAPALLVAGLAFRELMTSVLRDDPTFLLATPIPESHLDPKTQPLARKVAAVGRMQTSFSKVD